MKIKLNKITFNSIKINLTDTEESIKAQTNINTEEVLKQKSKTNTLECR